MLLLPFSLSFSRVTRLCSSDQQHATRRTGREISFRDISTTSRAFDVTGDACRPFEQNGRTLFSPDDFYFFTFADGRNEQRNVFSRASLSDDSKRYLGENLPLFIPPSSSGTIFVRSLEYPFRSNSSRATSTASSRNPPFLRFINRIHLRRCGAKTGSYESRGQ